MMRNSGVRSLLILIGFALWAGVAKPQLAAAGLLYPGGLPHPNAIAGASGTVMLEHDADNNPGTANQYYGDIEYSVFTAANFALAFPGEDNSLGGVAAGEFVYAFQVYNAGVRGDISQFAAGLADIGPPLFPFHHGDGIDDAESVNLGDQDFIAGTGQVPSSMQVSASALHGASSGSSVRFNFGPTVPARLNSGEWSAVLFYTSPWAPRWDNGSTTTGQGQSRIPGPEEGRFQPFIPEPSSLALVFVALVAMSLRRAAK
jgi:hypothetical protein